MSKPRTGAPKRVAVGLLAGSLAMFGVALAPPAGASATVTNERLAGANRYATASAISADEAFATPTTALVATGENFPDALAASTLAGANAAAPIILTQTSTYTAEAKAGLAALKGKGVTAVTIVGGTTAVSTTVENLIKADGFTVTRQAGADRYATAAAIATAANTKAAGAPVGGLKTALIATGTNFPDALAGGPAAYGNKLPLLLVNDTVPQATKDAIAALGIKKAVILGGTAVVSAAVATQLDTLTGNPSQRLAGTNRYGTAAAVGDYEIGTLAFPATSAILATGNNFPDALAAGPLGGQLKAPVVLTASLPAESAAFLDAHSNTITKLYVSGGSSAISDADVTAATTSAQTTSNDTSGRGFTTRPELVSATYVGTTTANNATTANPAGTYVLYTFDEPVTGAVPVSGSFKIYTGAGASTPATLATVSSTDNKSVVGYYAGLTDPTAAAVTSLTLATVVQGAVQGAGGAADTNIEGDAALTPSTTTTTTASAGVTAAPDLVSVGNFRAGSTGDVTAVDFTFDEAAFAQSTSPTTGYRLVLQDGTGVSCQGPATGTTNASGGSVPGGEGTAVVTVTCNEPPNGATFSTTTVARGVVATGTVADTVGGVNPNPLETADAGNSGNSSAPDLLSALFLPDAAPSSDTVAFVFDEAVQAAASTAGFRIYSSTGAEVAPLVVTRSSENNAIVAATYADNTLAGASYVGASVRTGAVTGVAGTGTINQPDEVAVTPSAVSTSSGSGKTDGPDLTGVAINTVTSAFGTVTHTATYTFDEDTGDTADSAGVQIALLHLVTADGIKLNCSRLSALGTATTLAGRDEATDNTVTCDQFVLSSNTGTDATAAQIGSAVVGTVEAGAARDETNTTSSPEGAERTSGGTGTPTA